MDEFDGSCVAILGEEGNGLLASAKLFHVVLDPCVFVLGVLDFALLKLGLFSEDTFDGLLELPDNFGLFFLLSFLNLGQLFFLALLLIKLI